MDDFFASAFGLMLCFGIPAILIAALAFLVNKTREQEKRTQLEIQKLVNSLPDASRSSFLIQYNAEKKNPTTAVVLALLLGGIGGHQFYLGNTVLGILYLVFSWTFIPAFIAFIEAFTISHTVHKMNQDVARKASALLTGDVSAVL